MAKCPACNNGTLQLRHRRRDGKPFLGCSNYPRCRHACDTESAPNGVPATYPRAESAGSSRSSIAPAVSLGARSLFHDHVAIFLQSAAVPSLLLEAITGQQQEEQFFPYCSWRIDYPSERLGDGWSLANSEVARALLKIQLRGRLTRLSPTLEAAIHDLAGTAFSPSTISPRALLGAAPPPNREANLWFDGAGVEKQFYNDHLADWLGPNISTHVIPQLHLSAFAGADASGQRGDFFVSVPGNKLLIELDDPSHQLHRQRDDSRDILLQNHGVRVLRIPYAEIQSKSGPHFDEAVSFFARARQAGVLDRQDSSFVALTRVAHQFQVAVLLAISRGQLPASSRPCIHVMLGSFAGSEAAVQATLEASASDLALSFRHMRKLWGSHDDNWPREFEIKFCSERDCTALGADSFGLSFGGRPKSAGKFYVIQNIYFERNLLLPFEPISPRTFAAPDQESVGFFLNYIFRMPTFREGQFEALSRALQGKDAIILLPTGAGKSVIFQLAGLLLPGISIVVAPLVSLIDDQVDNLSRQGIDRTLGISQALTRTGVMPDVLKSFGSGQFLFTYVSPERLQTPSFREALRQVAQSIGFNLVAIDETHCVSEWGHDFRTAYLNLGRTARNYCRSFSAPPPILALTGTASHAVLRDVQRILEITDHDAIITPATFDRKNLNFSVVTCLSSEKSASLRALLLSRIPATFGFAPTDFYLNHGRNSSGGICFCPHVGGEFGVKRISDEAMAAGVPNRFYGGDLEKFGAGRDWDAYKRDTMRQFKNNQVPVLVATKAAGMGLDKPNIRFTVHYGISSSIEAYYQECGRAGRDGKTSHCYLVLSVDHPVRAQRLLAPGTSIEELRVLHASIDWDSNDDVSRAVFFHVNAFSGVDAEADQVRLLLEQMMPLDSERVVRLSPPGGRDTKAMEKAMLRLLTLGVVSDYTVDYGSNELTATLCGAAPEQITDRFAKYVAGYNRGSVRSEVAKINRCEASHDAFVLRACRVLLEFIYGTIEQGRRRAMREMLALGQFAASVGADRQGAVIRQRILRYLETTFTEELEKMIETSDEGFAEVQKLLAGFVSESGELFGGIRSVRDAAEIRGQVIRYLESQPDHPGLLLLRAASEALCDGPDEEIVAENLVACAKAAAVRQNVSASSVDDTLASTLMEICFARPSVYHAMISGILMRLNGVPLARALLKRSHAYPEMALEPGVFLITHLSSQARLIFNEKD